MKKSTSDRHNDRHSDKIESLLCSPVQQKISGSHETLIFYIRLKKRLVKGKCATFLINISCEIKCCERLRTL